MKRLAIIFGIMCFGALLLLVQSDEKEKSGKTTGKNKYKKSHFHKEPQSV